MEAILFVGLPATGKSTFYKDRFFNTHVRINLDMLGTRRREAQLLAACISAGQSFVIDNTNVTIEQREPYIHVAKEAGARIIGYYFDSDVKSILKRNEQRSGKAIVPRVGIFGMKKRLQIPTKDEGFDDLYQVTIGPDKNFIVEKLK